MDTGSHLSTINEKDLRSVDNVELKSTKIKACSYSGDAIRFLGETDLTLSYGNVSVKHTFLVVDSKSVSLLGRDLCLKLNINLTVPSPSHNVDMSVNFM